MTHSPTPQTPSVAEADIPKQSFTLIAGDASDRKFYRSNDFGKKSICMEFPKWTGGYGGDPISWIGVHHALEQINIPVPRILKIDEANQCIWTEDFGDSFLTEKLTSAVLDRSDTTCLPTIRLYEQALKMLVKAQYPDQAMPAHPAQTRFFDAEKLLFELHFFKTHFLQGLLKVSAQILTQSYPQLDSEFERLASILASQPKVFCHRDYHLRNIMVVDNAIKWIDFQDARMGPHSYDVVSLIRDSYLRFEWKTRRSLSDVYLNALNSARDFRGLEPIAPNEFESESVLMGLQRNIKAVGSFGYLCTVKHKSSYIRYVKNTLDTILLPEHSVYRNRTINELFPDIYGMLSDIRSGSLAHQFAMVLEHEKIQSI